MKEIKKCAICGAELPPFGGNNPDPIIIDEVSEVCCECNNRYVIPARVEAIKERQRMEAAQVGN